MIRVAIDSGPLTSGHAVRGIGVMVQEYIDSISKYGKKEIKLEDFDFDSLAGKEKLENSNYDIVHYTNFFPYALTLPNKKYGKKTIVTIQDLIHLIYPDKYPAGVRGRLTFEKQKQRLKNIDHVLTISETSKKDVVRFLNIPAKNITKIYLAPKNIFKNIKDRSKLETVRKKYDLPEKFVFNLGDINYNKNIPTLIKACEISGLPLVLGGKHAKEIENTGFNNLMHLQGPMDYIRFLMDKPHPEHAHYMSLIEKFKNSKNIIRLGFIPDEDVAEIMNLATIYCQPSYYEGFGFSVLHAMICGTPCVISRSNCLVEIFGESSLIADPNDPEDFAHKFKLIENNKNVKEKLVKNGIERSHEFSYEKLGKELIEVYKNVV